MGARHAVAATSLASLAMLGACSDATAPNEANFRKALEPVVVDAYCRTITATPMPPAERGGRPAFPLTVAIAPAPGVYFDPNYDRSSVEMLDAAARGGMLTRREGEVFVRPRGPADPAVRQRTATYAPTPSGGAYFRSVERKTREGALLPIPEACGARGELVDVVRWTDPADFFGQRISQVTYTSRGVDPYPLWNETEKAKAATPVERTVPLALTSDGWRVMSR